MDLPGPEGVLNALILVLDRPGGQWRVDRAFEGLMPSGRPRNLGVAVMAEANFATDANGKPLAKPVSMLLASTWDLTGETSVLTRDDTTGAWTSARLAYTEYVSPQQALSQIRSFGFHRDQVTAIDYVFAGEDLSNGIPRRRLRSGCSGAHPLEFWSPELRHLDHLGGGFSRDERDHLRVTSFAEANDHLYAAVGQAGR